jgi:hypothetical protein
VDGRDPSTPGLRRVSPAAEAFAKQDKPGRDA